MKKTSGEPCASQRGKSGGTYRKKESFGKKVKKKKGEVSRKRHEKSVPFLRPQGGQARGTKGKKGEEESGNSFRVSGGDPGKAGEKKRERGPLLRLKRKGGKGKPRPHKLGKRNEERSSKGRKKED